MDVFETQSSDEMKEKIAELEAAGKTIFRMYLYWYEGAGRRKTKMEAGPEAAKFWDKLDKTQRLKVVFGHLTKEQQPPDIEELGRQYMECLARDYESFGGYSYVDGNPEDATMVIEYG